MEQEKIKDYRKPAIWLTSMLLLISILVFVIFFLVIQNKYLKLDGGIVISYSFIILTIIMASYSNPKRGMLVLFDIKHRDRNNKFKLRKFGILILTISLLIYSLVMLIGAIVLFRGNLSNMGLTEIFILEAVELLICILLITTFIKIHLFLSPNMKIPTDGLWSFVYEDFNYQNSYLFVRNGKAFLIDCGGSVKGILKFISINNIEITHVIITHFHIDHIFGLKDLYDYNNDVILKINSASEKYLYSDSAEALEYRQDLINRFDFKDLPNFKREFFNDNEEFTICGYKILPKIFRGHTPDTTFFHIEELNAVFIGDTLFFNDIGMHKFNYTNMEEFKDSIYYIINNTKNLIVYPGHYKTPFQSYEAKKWNLDDKFND